MSLDLRSIGKWIHSGRLSASPLPALRAILSLVLAYDVDPTIDEICTDKLGIAKPRRRIFVGERG